MTPIFNPATNYVLEDAHVLLRPLQADDYDNLLPFAIQEPNTWDYSLVSAKGTDGMRNYVDVALTARSQGKEYPFIIFDKTSGQYAGCTRFYDIQPAYQTLQLGYTWYGEKFRGTGLNKHCKFLLLQFAFDQLDIKRVEFRADARNQRSIAAMKSIGCTVEGVLRSHTPIADGRRDSIVLSILQHEWQQELKERLKAKL
ncbi:GNAT family N-acetyltransferase [Mucilaginibacter sp. SP1R1]|uniref:GNAT family N-acetyltransferase n=1 Tax=Mucilaginibacter sp. SP1R1 TaxID=2723091 RepID=UPI0016197438|nr:GNAT family protein [Mucilaginibacter sp. SP1R1]MBB6152577.1 RimJ/RimL family protein N-acetyltransferase [Mucilaginibacter sp. SP1R1]